MTSVLIADDQALVRDGFRSILEREGDVSVVGEAEDGVEALARAAATKPDVVLMDIRMPVLDGLTATRRLMAWPQPPRVLVLTTYDTEDNLYEALRAGASGFLLKDVRAAQLVDAVRTVAGGDALLAPRLVRRLIESYVSTRSRPARVPSGLDGLTAREEDVVLLIARGLSNAEIAAELVLSEATVKTHVNRILTKLGLRDRVQVVVLAYESGLVVPGGV
ncbi:MAG TPA: response regulator transcription factor [Nocardioidaceae bacterium]